MGKLALPNLKCFINTLVIQHVARDPGPRLLLDAQSSGVPSDAAPPPGNVL